MDKSLQDPELCKALLARLTRNIQSYGSPIRFMEVCGTHTVSIFQSGLRSLLPEGLIHISGPGCPVCVTHDSEVSLFLELAKKNVLLATFGDLMRVPAPDGQSLKHAQAEGADIHIVYSPMDAVTLAAKNPEKEVVFLGVGFETTAPTVAASVLTARRQALKNFSVLNCHKLVPPALAALLDGDGTHDCDIDAFLLPGHVCVILGTKPFEFVPGMYKRPAVVAGFEPAEILLALCMLTEDLQNPSKKVLNAYARAVSEDGSPAARSIMDSVFHTKDARWRGLGLIPKSGLAFRAEFAEYDAFQRFGLTIPSTRPIPGCKCGDILSGRMNPDQCPLFGKICTPQNPTGPCMVSTEGSCAAWYTYQGTVL